jgi:hypothetical protein
LCIQKWTFLDEFGNENNHPFLQCTQSLVATKTMSNPCRRHGWPLLYSFEGKMTQPTKCHAPIMHSKMDIREGNLLQMVLWKMVHFALFLVKISINFSPSYSTVFFFHHSVRLYFTKISKFYYKNFKIFVQCFNE